MDEFSNSIKQRGGWWFKFRASALRFRRQLGKFWWILFFSTAAGLAISAWVVFQQKAVFVSSGRMMVSGGIKLQEGAVFSEEAANFFGTQIELMKSEALHARAVKRLASMEPQLKPVPVTLTVSQLPMTSIFVLSATGGEPQYTQKLLDTIIHRH
jgi:uncharacterized protein involved in exopolysaccharide biosynthesis